MYFERALSMLEEMGDERGKAAVLHHLGFAYRRAGERQKATDYFLQSLKIVEQIGDEMNAATTMYELALLYEETADYEKALDLLGKVAKISDKAGHPESRIRKSGEIVERIKSRAAASGRAREQ